LFAFLILFTIEFCGIIIRIIIFTPNLSPNKKLINIVVWCKKKREREMSILPILKGGLEDPSDSLAKINSIILPDKDFSADSCSNATSLTPVPRFIESKMSNGDVSPSKNTVRSIKLSENWYSMENHLKNIFKVTVKPEDPEKIREDRLK